MFSEYICAHQRPQPGERIASPAQHRKSEGFEGFFLIGKLPGAEEQLEDVAVYV